MALPTASDNAFPSLLITEGTEPSAPAAGKQRLYIDSTSHLLKLTNSAGVESNVGSTVTSAFVGCALYNSAAQTITTATRTAVTFDTEVVDTSAFHAGGSPSRITVGTTGYYRFAAFVYFANNATGQRFIELRKNGTTLIQSARYNPGGNLTVAASVPFDVISLTATDYCEITVYQDSGGNLDIGHASANEVQHRFSVQFLGS